MKSHGYIFIEVLVSSCLLSWLISLLLQSWQTSEQHHQRLLFQHIAYQQLRVLSSATEPQHIFANWLHESMQRLPDPTATLIKNHGCLYATLTWVQAATFTIAPLVTLLHCDDVV